jgi:hypothetical protein
MRRLKLVLGVAALMVAIMAASAAPAAAQGILTTNDEEEDFCDFFGLSEEECLDFLFDDGFDNDFNGDNDFFDVVGDVGDLSQETEQEAESGEVDQSFEVTGGGDNSNQCVGIQGVANTGNTQNVIDVVDTTGDFGDLDRDDDFFDFGNGDFEFDEVDSSIDVSPTSTTTCDSQVNQAASATG